MNSRTGGRCDELGEDDGGGASGGSSDVAKNRGSIQPWRERTAPYLKKLTLALEAHKAPLGGKDSSL
ncbi:hypothetical protein TNCV_3513561 [Trichonephila clavipes]|nr:hypothetical protein TNCV_3513561 [Trichonephila clavipes]